MLQCNLLLRETQGLLEQLQAGSHRLAAKIEAALGCSRCWSCSDADKRNAAIRAVSNAADTVSVAEIARLVHEAGGHQRHVGEEELEVRDAGALVHVHVLHTLCLAASRPASQSRSRFKIEPLRCSESEVGAEQAEGA